MLILTPAYSRDYKSKKELLSDFNADKDFIVNDMFGAFRQWDGKPVNKPQLIEHQTNQVQFRYKKNTQTFIHKL